MRCQAGPEPSNQPPLCPRREISPYLSAIPLRRLKLRSKGRIRGEEEEEREKERGGDIYIYIFLSYLLPQDFSSLTWKWLSMELVLVRYRYDFDMILYGNSICLIRISKISKIVVVLSLISVKLLGSRSKIYHAANVRFEIWPRWIQLPGLKSVIQTFEFYHIIREIWTKHFNPLYRRLVFNLIFISHTPTTKFKRRRGGRIGFIEVLRIRVVAVFNRQLRR